MLCPGFGDTVSWVFCSRFEDEEVVNFRLNLTCIERNEQLDKCE